MVSSPWPPKNIRTEEWKVDEFMNFVQQNLHFINVCSIFNSWTDDDTSKWWLFINWVGCFSTTWCLKLTNKMSPRCVDCGARGPRSCAFCRHWWPMDVMDWTMRGGYMKHLQIKQATTSNNNNNKKKKQTFLLNSWLPRLVTSIPPNASIASISPSFPTALLSDLDVGTIHGTHLVLHQWGPYLHPQKNSSE